MPSSQIAQTNRLKPEDVLEGIADFVRQRVKVFERDGELVAVGYDKDMEAVASVAMARGATVIWSVIGLEADDNSHIRINS